MQRDNCNDTSIKSIELHLTRTERKKGNSNNTLIKAIEYHFILIHQNKPYITNTTLHKKVMGSNKPKNSSYEHFFINLIN